MDGENKRGKAVRHSDKGVRIATHLEVLKQCFTEFDPRHAIEHGMGISSTGFFHSQEQLATLLSIEEDKHWATCQHCRVLNAQGTLEHTVTSLGESLSLISKLPGESTVALVDGGETNQRFEVLTTCFNVGIVAIVEHDAESFNKRELNVRLAAARDKGYSCFQFVKLDPESLLYVKRVPDFAESADYVKL